MKMPLFVREYRPWLVLLCIGIASVSASFLVVWLTSLKGPANAFLGVAAGQAVIIAAFFNSHHLGLPIIRWGSKVLPGVLVGFLALVFSFAVTGAWSWILTHFGFPTSEQLSLTLIRTSNPASFAFMAIIAGFIAPIAEEIFFRGWLLTLIKDKLCIYRAVFFTALIFALLHGDLVIFPGLLLAGVFFGMVSARFGLHSAIAAHTVFNFLTIIAARSGWL